MAASPHYLSPLLRTQPKKDPSEYVKDGKITERLIYDGDEFRKPINLAGTTFEAGVSFRRCLFHESVNFRSAHFRRSAIFWRCVFQKEVDFQYSVFEEREGGALGSEFNGEANFSWSRFEQDVDFLWAQFKGPVFFWRTIFEKFVKLEATFNSDVVFEGDSRLIVVERTDFRPQYGILDFLQQAGVLSADNEDSSCAKMSLVDDPSALRKRLESVNLNADGVNHAMSVLARLQANMFSASGASFCGAKFAAPQAVKFCNVSLRTCRFLNSNAGQAKFQNVQWDRQPTLLWATRRRAVCDERPASSNGNLSLQTLRALGTLYNDLRVSHEEKALFDDAADFQYGEMETKRLSQPIPLRLISLTAWYRYLSAYGIRPGLALFWLLVAIFVVFPLLYFVTGYSRHILDLITYSLETSTFMEGSKISAEPAKSALPMSARFVAGFERLTVTLQAGLFALALRRKFGRA